MHRIGSQKGQGRVGCLFWILVLLILALVGSRVIPVKIATMQLKDHIDDLVIAHPRHPQSFFEKEIRTRAEQLNLKIPKDQIKVNRTDERIIIDIRFTAPLDFLAFTYDWDISIYEDRDVFIF
jgi:hypothetical protein